MSDYTRGDDPVYNGFREGWACPCDAKEGTEELWEIVEGIPLDRLEEICAAERDGRLVVLPCKVGDVLYVLTSDSLTGIEETKCKRITIKTLQDGSVAKIIAPCVLDDWGGAFRELYLQDFGKTVFLTRAEAEAALKGAEHE